MPIRLNFLAEQQAVEELKRRDPVKRVVWLVALVVGALVLWGGYLQLRLLQIKGQTASVDAEFKQVEPVYRAVLASQGAVNEAARKVAALQTLRSNRFLWASALNALQQVVMPDVRLVEVRVDQSYALTEAVPAKTNQAGQIISPAKPPVSSESIRLEIQARDQSPNPGDAILGFQELLSQIGYFRTNFAKAELITRSPIQTDTETSNRFVLFTIQCQVPEISRTPVK